MFSKFQSQLPSQLYPSHKFLWSFPSHRLKQTYFTAGNRLLGCPLTSCIFPHNAREPTLKLSNDYYLNPMFQVQGSLRTKTSLQSAKHLHFNWLVSISGMKLCPLACLQWSSFLLISEIPLVQQFCGTKISFNKGIWET